MSVETNLAEIIKKTISDKRIEIPEEKKSDVDDYAERLERDMRDNLRRTIDNFESGLRDFKDRTGIDLWSDRREIIKNVCANITRNY